jgi:hypothetical protein
MTFRQHVTSVALLGGCQSPKFENNDSPLDTLLDQLSNREPARRLLDTIALVVCYEEAGVIPLQAPPAVQPAVADSRPVISATAAGLLASLLADRRPLLSEWLSLLLQSGMRLYEETVPALLDVATTDRTLRSAVREVAGPLGQWLAQFRPEWAWLQGSELNESDWENGTPDQRLDFLRYLRSSNPARATELASSTWASESTDMKRQILQAFTVGRYLADEQFLEAALDDRSIVVRRLAADQLASIPGSKLIQRMSERLAGRLSLTKVLNVAPFEELDDAMLRDGIEKKPSGTTLGERAWWTMQALAAVPPGKWVKDFSLTPDHLIEAAKEGQWSSLLLEGWRTAAIRHRDEMWLQSLAGQSATVAETSAIFRALSDNARETTMTRLWQKDAKAWLSVVPVYCSHQWTRHFTQDFIAIVEKNLPIDATDTFTYQLKPLLRAASSLAAPDADKLSAAEPFAEFTDTLNFRRAMRQALRQE